MPREPAISESLVAVEVPPGTCDLPVPRFVDIFIRDAEDRAEAYGDAAGNGLFSPGDARCAYQVLLGLLRSGAATPGSAFLEWGSGQGLVAILASFLGFQSTGVEIDAALVAEAKRLAERYDCAARFIHGSYRADERSLPVVSAEQADVVHVYPWPGEEEYFLNRFDSTARPGALLLICLGPEDIRVYRKVQ